MKKIFLTGFLIAASLVTAAAQGKETITIRNNTGYTVYYLKISQTASDSWGEDLLGSSVLNSGQSFTYRLPFPLNVVNRYDMMMEDSDGDKYYKWNVQVSNGAVIEFTMADFNRSRNSGGGGSVANNSGGLPTVTIVNNTGYTIWYVKFSAASSDSWGNDRLGSSQTISNGSSVTLTLDSPLSTNNRYDIQLTDSDRDTYTKWNVTMTGQNTVVTFTMADFDSR